MPAPSRDNAGPPSLLLALRHVARPDRARVAAYLSLARSPAAWDAYREFLEAHREWIASLGRALAAAGVEAERPLPDGADRAGPGSDGGRIAAVPPPRDGARALGYQYVLEAFRLGCSALARRGRGGPRPAARGPWAKLNAALAAVPPGEQAGVVEGAREAFTAWERELAPWLISDQPSAVSDQRRAVIADH